MADQSPPELVAETVRRIRSLNEKIITSLTDAGLEPLVGYEVLLSNLAAYEIEVNKIGQVDWFSTVVDAHATFVRATGPAWATVARALLSDGSPRVTESGVPRAADS